MFTTLASLALLLANAAALPVLAAAEPARPSHPACRMTDEGLLSCPDSGIEDQIECLHPAGLACGADQDCLVQVMSGCLGILEHAGWHPGPPPKPGLAGECTIAATWRTIAESKCSPGCPGDSYPTDEGCYCVLTLPDLREIHWRPLNDDGHFGSLFWPSIPFPGRILSVHFWYDTSVPYAFLDVTFDDGSYRSLSFCD